jgi:uncharacterized membrane protein YbhN (UPF0104 family)
MTTYSLAIGAIILFVIFAIIFISLIDDEDSKGFVDSLKATIVTMLVLVVIATMFMVGGWGFYYVASHYGATPAVEQSSTTPSGL